MLESPTEAEFARRVGQKFELQLDSLPSLELELIDVRAAGSPPPEGKGRSAPFSIVFRGPLEPQLAQRIYRLVHEEMGTLELFLVPVSADADGCCYEAVFG